MAEFAHFKPSMITFLRQLARNNTREWFADNKQRYEDLVREPALDFISAMGQPLADITPYFVAVPKKTGGSLMRPYRDTRFSKDKTPYKTNVGIQFRYEFGKDVHAPGFYVHIDPHEVFVGAGMWHPDREPLRAIRDAIVDDPKGWKAARDQRTFRRHFDLAGSQLKTAPRGFDKSHPMIDDLRRKDFIGVKVMTHDVLYSPQLLKTMAQTFRAASPFMTFLCRAVGARF
ncbi:MAG: DUF2461 domain-containing protein [Pseudomonadota bacterium]